MAKQLVTEYINSNYNVPGDRLVVLDAHTIEKEYGWVFFYDSLKYLETGDCSYLIAGNSPIIVEKQDGSLHTLGTALSPEESIKEYEAKREKRGSH